MLKPEHFSYKCPLKISDLEATEDGGHFCAKCSKDIHDLTDCSLDEIRELQSRKGSLCGFVRAVGVTSMVSLAACSEDENAANANAKGKPPQEPNIPVEPQTELLGDICIPENIPNNIPEKEVPKPPIKPAPAEDGHTEASTEGNAEQDAPVKELIEIERRVILGKICPPNELIPEVPEEPKPLDPNREGSPS